MHKALSPAELKTIRESLGLTAQWVADQAGVRVRSVQYWEQGRHAIPDEIANMIVGLDRKLDALVDNALVQLDRLADTHGLPSEIVLVRYRRDADLWRFRPDMRPLPVTAHAVLLTRLRRALAAKNIGTSMVYMEPDAYTHWLDGRPDTEIERSTWAATLTARTPDVLA